MIAGLDVTGTWHRVVDGVYITEKYTDGVQDTVLLMDTKCGKRDLTAATMTRHLDMVPNQFLCVDCWE